MRIGIIGQGFVGNAVFQKFKHFFEILTFDLDAKKCNSNLKEISISCDIVFICVPTPMNDDGSCDVTIVDRLLYELNELGKLIVVNKSTVLPGTTESFNMRYKSLSVIFNPEFLTERNAVNDFNNQNRIILGGPRSATTIVKQMYSKVFPDAYIIKTGSSNAEMVKYFTNSFLANKVSFANEMYELCQSLNLDYDKVAEYANLDKRLGSSHWAVPGPDGDYGFGGHCLPKDLSAITKLTEKLGTTNFILKAIVKTNNKFRTNRDWESMIGRAVNKTKK